MDTELLRAAQEEQFETMITALIEQGYAVCDGFLDPPLLAGLRKRLYTLHSSGMMRPAGIGRSAGYHHNTGIRGDLIHWIAGDSKDVYEQLFLEKVGDFMDYLNRTCYTSLDDHEFHYARYEPGSFYKRHLDQFRGHSGRKYTLVVYLNEDWNAADGGQVVLFTEHDSIEVLPLGGRAIFFKSDVTEHEVRPSFRRHRLSITGWLKSG